LNTVFITHTRESETSVYEDGGIIDVWYIIDILVDEGTHFANGINQLHVYINEQSIIVAGFLSIYSSVYI
jgi:hypothetical protein